jgi:hypothetical protein
MGKANDFITIINEWGRKRQEMGILLGALSDTLQEHFWKLFVYHSYRPEDVAGWVLSLNKHLSKLRRYNKSKRFFKRINAGRDLLHDILTDTFFGTQRDVELLASEWSRQGYPKIDISEKDRKRLMSLVDKYIEYILDDSKGDFIVTLEDLI